MTSTTTTTTLATLWQSHADATLPITASQAEVLSARRQWYGAQLDRLAAIKNRSAAEEALFQEAIGFGRTIGRAEERATV